jgi:alpha-amylase/alpha-mannosidase (GH57 family)
MEIQKAIKEHKQVIFERCNLIDTLLSEVDSIISTTILTSPEEVLLQFEDDQRTVTWNGGRLKLGHKSWLFVKTLWDGNYHVASIEKIERIVWVRKNRKKRIVKVGKRKIKTDTISRNTFNSFLQRLKHELRGAFPYKIIPVKSRRTREIAGYRLKRTKLCIKKLENTQ